MLYLLLFAAPADLIVVNANVLTLDAKNTTARALAVTGGKLTAVGTAADVRKLAGPKTVTLDAGGKTLLPGLYDSHVHPIGAVTTDLADPPPVLRSLKEAFRFIRDRAKGKPKGEWIVLRYVFPTRLDEARFPTLAELDDAAPDHPVLFHAGPAGMVNSAALKVSKITRDTKSPRNGMIVKDARGEPTGMIRSAYGALKGVPSAGERVTPEKLRAGVRELFARYNEQGLTSVADRNGSLSGLALYRDLAKKGELTVRVNAALGFDANQTPEQADKRLKQYEEAGGPTEIGRAHV